jgi:hypothetical protein
MGNFEWLRGCGTALITPFLPDGSVDAKALASLVGWQIQEGIHFLVPCGTTGESPTLKHDEHLAVVDITTRTAAGRVPILAGAGGNNTSKVIDLIAEVKKLGVNGILSVAPYYNKPTQEGIYQHDCRVQRPRKNRLEHFAGHSPSFVGNSKYRRSKRSQRRYLSNWRNMHPRARSVSHTLRR